MPTVQANGLSLYYESRGNEGDPVILMIMGLGVQMILWPEPLVDVLVNAGFRVVRFDNRDVGLSSHLDHLGMPNVPMTAFKFLMHLPLKADYYIDDMAADTAALIDALGLKRPHVVGASMGGMISQNLSANYPDKVASLTSIMSTTGRRSLPRADWRVTRAMMEPRGARWDTEIAIERMARVLALIGSRTYPADKAHLRAICERHILRSNYPPGGARQLMAIIATGDRTRVVRKIGVPTLVLHGDEDPLLLPACGRETAHVIHQAGGKVKLSIIEGMGHDLPLPLLPKIAEEIIAHCRASS